MWALPVICVPSAAVVVVFLLMSLILLYLETWEFRSGGVLFPQCHFRCDVVVSSKFVLEVVSLVSFADQLASMSCVGFLALIAAAAFATS